MTSTDPILTTTSPDHVVRFTRRPMWAENCIFEFLIHKSTTALFDTVFRQHHISVIGTSQQLLDFLFDIA